MSTTATDLPPHDPETIVAADFPERVRLACRNFAHASPNSPVVMALYWAKYLFGLIGGWAFWCSFNHDYAGFTEFSDWMFTGDAFKKAVAWSMFWELAGFGNGWGPLNARFGPMFGGFRHWARTGTIKLPLFRGAPLIGGDTRNWIDVIAYVATELLLLRVIVSPEVTSELLFPCFLAVPILGVLDKTLFLCARAEHYWVAMTCLTFAVVAGQPDEGTLWLSFCKIVWGFIWFWAAASKLNHHFPYVIMFMMNNGPFFPKFLKKSLFRGYPDDLRPSRFATFMAHFGTLAEFAIPLILLTSTTEVQTFLGVLLATGFHTFIGINNPNGMPVEWNILMVYAAWALFWCTGFDAPPAALFEIPGLLAFVVACMFFVPLYGNFVPKHVSFLLSMRYYAGNWMYNVWLFKKGDAVKKLQKLKKNTDTVREQLERVLETPEEVEAMCNAQMTVSRFMHLQGRPLLHALPVAVDDIEDYDWYEGELLGGAILGWNFGDGHLNGEQLMRAIQPICGFEEGELRIVSVESQPLFGATQHWQVFDAATGLVTEGVTDTNALRFEQPWPTGEYAEALRRGRKTA